MALSLVWVTMTSYYFTMMLFNYLYFKRCHTHTHFNRTIWLITIDSLSKMSKFPFQMNTLRIALTHFQQIAENQCGILFAYCRILFDHVLSTVAHFSGGKKELE